MELQRRLLLDRFSMKETKNGGGDKALDEKIPFREAVESLMYLMTCTCPDLATSLSMVSHYRRRQVSRIGWP